MDTICIYSHSGDDAPSGAEVVQLALHSGRFLLHPVSIQKDGRKQVILMGDLLCVGREDKPGRGEGAPEKVRDQRVSRQEDGRCQVGFCP